MNEKHKKTCMYLNYVEHPLISTSSFILVVCVPARITSYVTGLKICPITAGISQL